MLSAHFTLLDWIALVFIVGGAIQGFFRGLSGEMARLLGAICAFVAGALLHEPLGNIVAGHTRLIDQEARILTYIITVIAALILWALFQRLIRKLLRLILSTGFDKVTGVPAGMLRMTTLVAIVFIAMNLWPQAPLQKHFGTASFFGRQAIRLVPALKRELERRNLPPHNAPENATPPQQENHAP